jgi:transcription elongation GreA/GreB family factor
MDKKNILTYEGLKKLEDELEDLKVVKRKEVSQKSRATYPRTRNMMRRRMSRETLKRGSSRSRRS